MGDAADGMLANRELDMLFSGRLRRSRPHEDFAQPFANHPLADPQIFERVLRRGRPLQQETNNMSIRETAQAQLERNEAERQRLLTRLALIDQFGEEDPWENDAVLTFVRTFSGPHQYTHVALKAGGVWYVTGSRNQNRAFTWEELVEEHLAKSLPDSILVVTEWKRYEDV